MDNFTSTKFGSDNASCEQDSKMTLRELEILQEDTLERQAAGEAVNEEDGDMEEVEDYGPEFPDDWYDASAGLDDDVQTDDYGDEQPSNPGERAYEAQHKREYGEDYDGNPVTFEEQVDHRWNNREYFLIDEAVDWESMESDPKQMFTIGNSKVGKDTIIFNLQPARFCPSMENGMCKIVKPIDGRYKIACYAYQDERQYKASLQLRLRQMRFWDTHTAQEIFDKLADFYALSQGDSMTYPVLMAMRKDKKDKKGHPNIHGKEKSIKLKYIRFNQSGDLKDKEDAEKMDEVARLAKEELGLVTYTYTARKDILAQYKFKHVHV